MFLVELLAFHDAFYRWHLHVILVALFPERTSITSPALSLLLSKCQQWACCWWARVSMKAFSSLGLSGVWGTIVLEKTAESRCLVAPTKKGMGVTETSWLLYGHHHPCSRSKKNHTVYRCMVTYCFLLWGNVAGKAQVLTSPGDGEQQTREKGWL